ncbi:MAG: hemolysin family protein [Propylenella sp.]
MPGWELIVIAFLFVLNGFFAMTELAVMSSRRARLEHMAEHHMHGARAALRLLGEPTRFLSTVQVAITLVGVFAGAFSGATLAEPLGRALEVNLGKSAYPVALAVVVVGITYLSLVIGELVPKRIAIHNPERVASLVAPVMAALAMAGAPVVWLLGVSTDALVRLLRIPATREHPVTEDEVRRMIAEGTTTGVFHVAERDMIDGVLRLADRSVRSVMTPRVEIDWIDLDDPPEAIRREIAESGHSRYPAGRKGLDEMVGIVHTKHLLDQMARSGRFDVAASLRQPLIVHEATPALRLLEMFRENPIHMAVVVDEYGVLEGIVTPTDILAAIAGALPEDLTEEEEAAVRRADGSWLMDGMIGIDEAERLLERKGMRGDEDFETLAGFLLARLGHIPQTGERFDWDGLRFEVVDMDGRRIDRVLVAKAEHAPAAEAGAGV